MGNFDVMQVCMNGHQITAYYNSSKFAQDYCSVCGAKTITACPSCNTPIRGYYHSEVISIEEVPVPSCCHNCGKSYPWAKKASISSSVSAPLQTIELICLRFNAVVIQLKKRHDNRPTLKIEDEYDVQDLLHALLKINFDDIRPEEWTPSYAGTASRMDFLLKKEKIVIETKKSRSGLKDREIGEQLIVDIEKYKRHPDCNQLFCFIYDPEHLISNPCALEGDLSKKHGNLEVKVLITPKG